MIKPGDTYTVDVLGEQFQVMAVDIATQLRMMEFINSQWSEDESDDGADGATDEPALREEAKQTQTILSFCEVILSAEDLKRIDNRIGMQLLIMVALKAEVKPEQKKSSE